MQRDEALLFPLGVAQTVGRGQAASPIQPPLPPCPGRCSSQRAGFITSPDEMGFPNKRALTPFSSTMLGVDNSPNGLNFFVVFNSNPSLFLTENYRPR